mmetsp:Transcript_16824/g.30540  ORF Transcript_16824/g.30540 Transcript_16824/m.30540 type:complete len:156 (+) Transcript_16824:86-553(+)
MNESFSSPKPYCPEKYLACPPKPREGKPSVSFDDKNFIVMPLFFPSRRHTLGTNDSTDSEVNGDPAKINMPAAEFNRKNRPYNSEAPSRKISIENFPTLPFSCSAPTNQAPSSHPLPVRMPRSSSDPNKVRPFERRRSSIAHVEGRHTTFNARCA